MTVLNDKDIGAYLEGAHGLQNTAVTAGGAGDGAYTTTGEIIDKLALTGNPESAAVVIGYVTTLASAETLTIAAKIEHDPDNASLSSAADYTYGGAEVNFGVLETGSASSAVGAVTMPVDLSGVGRYFRVSVKPTLSAASTSTVALVATWAFGAGDSAPVS